MRRFLSILRRLLLIFLLVALGLVLVGTGLGLILVRTAEFHEPDIRPDTARVHAQCSDSLRRCGRSSLVLNREGVWEAYLFGSAQERGLAMGAMSRDLLEFQERCFIEQMHRLVPRRFYIRLLGELTKIFNRNMAGHIPTEFLEEIFAISLYCTHDYDYFGTPYVRQLNYHAAHDIGHAMQEYMLVGCTSFGVWGEATEDGGLLLGRNFDFFVGEEFARNKVLYFVYPDSGFRFVSYSWAGFVGVVTGMNERGLSVSLHAAKGPMPTQSAMPVSLLARQILQYAHDIESAVALAREAQTFVSESLLIGSQEDGRACIIEKTPASTALYEVAESKLVCANHFQSESLTSGRDSLDNLPSLNSPFRQRTMRRLLDSFSSLSPELAARILRYDHGPEGESLGLGCEMALNQRIGLHSVIFRPGDSALWVSTAPWQDGPFLGFRLGPIFHLDSAPCTSQATSRMTIPADSLFIKNRLPQLLKYRQLERYVQSALQADAPIPVDSLARLVALNPSYFLAHSLVGDAQARQGNWKLAKRAYQRALDCAVPLGTQRQEIISKIHSIREKEF